MDTASTVNPLAKFHDAPEEVEHSTTLGGTVTLDTLLIDRGYWRATNTSLEVLACHNSEACHGNEVTGTPGCREDGYKGPCTDHCFQLHVLNCASIVDYERQTTRD